MDSQPLPTSLGSGLRTRDAAPPSPGGSQPGPKQLSDPIVLVDVLRQALAAGTRSTDSILRAAADTARILTGAHGTAVALRTNGVIICRARSGEIAPELGAPLNVSSGISGSCLRTATITICNDAATDKRVDSEVCFTLGVRSIVVVPLRGTNGIVGILEAFSSRPYAFGAKQIDSLRALAEIAETAYDCESGSRNPTRDRLTSPAIRPAPITADEILESRLSDESRVPQRYWIPAFVAMALLLVSLTVWLSWSEPAETAASERPARTLNASREPSGHPAARILSLKSDSGITDRQSDASSRKQALQNAAEIEPATGGAQVSKSAGAQSEVTSAEKSMLSSTLPGPASEAPPSIAVTTAMTPDELARLSSMPAAVPMFGASVSRGVTEGNLIRKVEPVYPPEASIQKLAGSVTLDATIAEDGSIREVNVVSGPPPLAVAATEAVRQWRYQPSRLRGKPTAVQKRITIVFKLPD